MTTKSTCVLSLNFTMPLLLCRGCRRVAFAIVIAEGRREFEFVFETYEPPTNLALIAAVLGLAKKPMMVCSRTSAKNGVSSIAFNTWICCGADKPLNLFDSGNKLLRPRLKSFQPFGVNRLLFAVKGRQRAIDEIEASGFTGPRCFISWNNLGDHAFNFRGLLR